MCEFDSAARVAVEGCYHPVIVTQCRGDDGAWRTAKDNVPVATQPARIHHETRMTPPAKPLAALDALPEGIVYLGSPYSKYKDGLTAACKEVAKAAAKLMERGLAIYSPIVHSHVVAHIGGMNKMDWDFWKKQDLPLMDAASSMIVLKLEGWQDSIGLTYEIARFHEASKPIVYVTMEELANG